MSLPEYVEQELCYLCFRDWKELLVFGDNYFILAESPNKDEWIVLEQPGHNGYDVFAWKAKPFPDPFIDDEDYEGDEAYELACDAFMDATLTDTAESKTDYRHGFSIVKRLIELGYDPEEDGNLSGWMFDYLGKLLKDG